MFELLDLFTFSTREYSCLLTVVNMSRDFLSWKYAMKCSHGNDSLFLVGLVMLLISLVSSTWPYLVVVTHLVVIENVVVVLVVLTGGYSDGGGD